MGGQRRAGYGSTRKLASGRWQARIPDPRRPGKHLSLGTFRTKLEATTALGETQRQQALGVWIHPDERTSEVHNTAPTVGELFEQYLSTRALKTTTINHYRGLYRRIVEPAWHNTRVDAITRKDVATWWANLRATHPDRAPNNAQGAKLLRGIMQHAVTLELIEHNPVTVQIKKPPRKRERAALTGEQLTAVVQQLPDQYRLPVMLAASTGLRVGEWCELRGRDVQETPALPGVLVLNVTRHWSRDGGVDTGTKTQAHGRVVPVPPDLQDAIQQRATAVGADGLLFTTAYNTRMTYAKVNKVLAHACTQAGVEVITSHDLRSTAGTRLAVAGVDLATIMAILGHSDVKTAMGYQATTMQRAAKAVERLSAERGGGSV